MVPRILQRRLVELFERHPVVTLTGPRQSGKTTLCRSALPNLAYVNLENPDRRDLAIEDPRAFLRRYGEGAILDEIQRAPELVSYLQPHIDEKSRNGLFVLTGSQQLRVTESVNQSLAGRTAILRLLPFSIREAASIGDDMDVDTMLFTGFYPRIYDQRLDPDQALGDYIETYVERDVRQVGEIRNLSAFRKFVRLCAGRVGQILNLDSLGNDAGVSQPTAKAWISVLEASYLVFLLPPFHPNVSKRLIKSPKLYFYDVGLAAHLLGIENPGQVLTHPLKGGLFENLVIVEAMKHRFNQGKRSNLHFYRDSRGHEVDLILTYADRYLAVEIKSAETISSAFFDSLKKLRSTVPGMLGAMLVHGGSSSEERHDVRVTNPHGFVDLLAEMADD